MPLIEILFREVKKIASKNILYSICQNESLLPSTFFKSRTLSHKSDAIDAFT